MHLKYGAELIGTDMPGPLAHWRRNFELRATLSMSAVSPPKQGFLCRDRNIVPTGIVSRLVQTTDLN